MKAISIKQPWAKLIAHGKKTIEVRSWPTHHRGPLLIVSSAQPETAIMKRTTRTDANGATWLNDLFEENQLRGFYHLGAAACIVDVVGCEPFSNDKHAAGANFEADDAAGLYAWLLSNPRKVAPRRITGKLKFYEVDNFKIIEL